ncbi:MAG: CGNR zinc finger domain-containing protein [Solirubrobacteraceae bacterium MAG38_C4-C5]|nr:CGNR zinc finger domain-containing protein [Candidatus Siliceabacter maunaloa]
MADEARYEVAKKPAPPPLALVQDYVNTTKLLYRQERLASPDLLRRWLSARRLLERDHALTVDDLRDAVDLRESLRGLMLANTTGRPNAQAVEVFNRIVGDAGLRAHLGPDARPAIEPCTSGARGGFGMIASTVLLAMIDGSWQRLKACANADCQWSFYDRSPSGSGTWCEMAVCGSRAKMRAYRQRRSTVDGPTAGPAS